MTSLNRKESTRVCDEEYEKRLVLAKQAKRQVETYVQREREKFPKAKHNKITLEQFFKEHPQATFNVVLQTNYQGQVVSFESGSDVTPLVVSEVACLINKQEEVVESFNVRRGESVYGSIEIEALEEQEREAREGKEKQRVALQAMIESFGREAVLSMMGPPPIATGHPAIAPDLLSTPAPLISTETPKSDAGSSDKSGGGLLGGFAGVFGKNL
ncbi:hypothetical protein CYMTET_10053 [Cymbomonas tetramitiformis]|uniref:Uncharacterized protein n=1 Tax=Cymbomonas tetramitiformis TaxID=36881 RepID=A0AAE0LEE0_9CHLO|nr:hypothetical protein CYMTET_10053 [Cymbomonas tetramitiformis]